jgi:hypothetical protein
MLFFAGRTIRKILKTAYKSPNLTKLQNHYILSEKVPCIKANC